MLSVVTSCEEVPVMGFDILLLFLRDRTGGTATAATTSRFGGSAAPFAARMPHKVGGGERDQYQGQPSLWRIG